MASDSRTARAEREKIFGDIALLTISYKRSMIHYGGLSPQPSAAYDSMMAELRLREAVDAASLKLQECICKYMPAEKTCAYCQQQKKAKSTKEVPKKVTKVDTLYLRGSSYKEWEQQLQRHVQEQREAGWHYASCTYVCAYPGEHAFLVMFCK